MSHRVLALLAAALGVALVRCHRSLLTKASCDGDYGSSQTALPVPDPSISWAFSHYLDCTHRVVWMSFVSPADNFTFYVGVGTPPMPRFSGLRADALIIGPGLPELSATDLESLPSEVRADPVWNSTGMGAILHRSPADQSTCAHLGTVMAGESTVKDGRCDFYEPFEKTNSWRILDADGNLIPQKDGVYFVAVWLQQATSGKLGIALGTWVEDFVTPFNIATPSCSRSLLDWSEKKGDQETCLPVLTCPRSAPIPEQVCTAQGSCGTASCDDTIATNPMCTFGQMCDCTSIIQDHPCGTEMQSAMGNVPINSICGKTCDACGSTVYEPSMGCGGTECPSSVELWDKVSMKMHSGMAIQFSCDVALDFVRGMIPHHRGAVDMCKVLVEDLSCQEDGALSGLVHFCNHVEWEQEIEVTGMLQWLAARGLDEHAGCTPHSGECVRFTNDTISASPLCQYGGQCSCEEVIKENPCGTTITGPNGDTVINEICGGTCKVCSEERRLAEGMMMGCGNLTCPSSEKLLAVNMKMTHAMSINFSCDHAVDFVRGMIPHHAGAIAMCEVLKESMVEPDAYLTELCANITRVQWAEIAFLSDWLVARDLNIGASCKACEDGVAPAQPQPICDDRLPASSFCHVLGGDFYCTCEGTVSQHACGEVVEVAGFGHLNVSAECMRTCGHCHGERQPLFHDPCGDVHGSSGHGGSGAHGHGSGAHGEDDTDSDVGGTSVNRAPRLPLPLPLSSIVFALFGLASVPRICQTSDFLTPSW